MDNPELNKMIEDFKNFKLETQAKARQTIWDNYVQIVYWSEKSERFYLRHDRGCWTGYSEKYLRQQLEGNGFFDWIVEPDPKKWKSEALLFWKQFVNHITNYNSIKGAGVIGGRMEGILEEGNEKFLITSSPKIITPVQGDCTFILWYLTQLLPGPQLNYFLAWLKHAYTSLVQQSFSCGQVLFFIGPPQCGKSLLQIRLITPILGGISAEPFTHMIGESRFNSDLIKAGHLHIEDKGISHRQFDRHKFADAIKELAVGTKVRCEGKGQDAFMVYPIRRLTISLNGDSYNFETIPELEEGFVDKISVFNCGIVDFGMPSSRIEEKIASTLPAFVDYLVKLESPPEILTDDRFGVKCYIDPFIREKIEGFSPETRTLQMMDVYLNEGDQEFIEGRAMELWGMLNASAAAKGLLFATNTRSVDWLGRRLSAASKKYPSRIIELPRTKDGTTYKIYRNGNGNHTLI